MTTSVLKWYPHSHTLATAVPIAEPPHAPPPLLVFIWNCFRAERNRHPSQKSEGLGSRRIHTKFCSLQSGLLEHTFSGRHTAQRPQLGEAATLPPCPCHECRLKIEASDSPSPAWHPVGALGRGHQGRGLLRKSFSSTRNTRVRVYGILCQSRPQSQWPCTISPGESQKCLLPNTALELTQNKGKAQFEESKEIVFYMQQQQQQQNPFKIPPITT